MRDLAEITTKLAARPGALVSTENLTTVFVAVPKQGAKDFLTGYETLTDFVVGRT